MAQIARSVVDAISGADLRSPDSSVGDDPDGGPLGDLLNNDVEVLSGSDSGSGSGASSGSGTESGAGSGSDTGPTFPPDGSESGDNGGGGWGGLPDLNRLQAD
jgi:hypothetical protein